MLVNAQEPPEKGSARGKRVPALTLGVQFDDWLHSGTQNKGEKTGRGPESRGQEIRQEYLT